MHCDIKIDHRSLKLCRALAQSVLYWFAWFFFWNLQKIQGYHPTCVNLSKSMGQLVPLPTKVYPTSSLLIRLHGLYVDYTQTTCRQNPLDTSGLLLPFFGYISPFLSFSALLSFISKLYIVELPPMQGFHPCLLGSPARWALLLCISCNIYT